jgi:hypothetical protein
MSDGIVEAGTWKRLSTNNIRLRGLRDKNDGSYPKNAAVTMNMLDKNKAPFALVQGVAMAYASGDGAQTIYRGAVPANIDIPADDYFAEVIAVIGGNQRRFIKPLTVED